MNIENFSQLYFFCQTITSSKISRRDIQLKIQELCPTEKIIFQKVNLDPNVVRAFYFTKEICIPANSNHQCYKQHVISFSRQLNYCWERFVCVKEMMHVFDDNDEFTETPELLSKLIDDLTVSSTLNTPQSQSDVRAFWMALACVCTEAKRKEFREKLSKNLITTNTIAVELRIPEQYIPSLLSEQYDIILQTLITK